MKLNYSTYKEIENFYLEGFKITEIAKKLAVDRNTVNRHLSRVNLKDKSKRDDYVDLDVAKITKLYNENWTLADIASKYSCSIHTVKNRLENNGVDLRGYFHNDGRYISTQYKLDINSFDTLETEQQAYFLGLLYADGNLGKDSNSITLAQAENNKEIVYKFRDFLKSDKPIYINERSKKNPKWQDTHAFTVHCEKLYKDLQNLGLIPNKTLILTYPTCIPEHLHRHFIRGFFDGDGTIGKTMMQIDTTPEFLEGLQSILVEQAGVNKNSIYICKNKTNCGKIGYGGRLNLQKIYDYFYKGSTTFLTRKKLKFEESIANLSKIVEDKNKAKEERDKQIIKLYNEGLSQTELAEQFNMTQANVSLILKPSRKNGN